jgi:predicted MFS family arabinose efflux permease
MGFGHIDTSMAATARTLLHNQRELGLLFTAIAGGSAIGGLWYGSRPRGGLPYRRLPVALALFAAMLLTLPGVVATSEPPLAALLPLLFATGLSIAPSLIMQQALADRLAAADRLGEAQAWLTAASTTGAAAGTAVAGILVDRFGVPVAFLGAAVAVAAAAGIAARAGRRWRLADGDASSR